MNGDEYFLRYVVDGTVVHAQAANRPPNEGECFLIDLVEGWAHHGHAGCFGQGEMSNVISGANGKWDSEGQSAAFSKAAASRPTRPRRFIGYVSGHPEFYQRIPATLGFSNCGEISHFGPDLRQSRD